MSARADEMRKHEALYSEFSGECAVLLDPLDRGGAAPARVFGGCRSTAGIRRGVPRRLPIHAREVVVAGVSNAVLST